MKKVSVARYQYTADQFLGPVLSPAVFIKGGSDWLAARLRNQVVEVSHSLTPPRMSEKTFLGGTGEMAP